VNFLIYEKNLILFFISVVENDFVWKRKRTLSQPYLRAGLQPFFAVPLTPASPRFLSAERLAGGKPHPGCHFSDGELLAGLTPIESCCTVAGTWDRVNEGGFPNQKI
jgi:hypothetical protein